MKKKTQQPETIIPIGAPNDDENRGVRLCKQVLLFVTQNFDIFINGFSKLLLQCFLVLFAPLG